MFIPPNRLRKQPALQFREIAQEISRNARMPLPEAESRVWREALDLGANVGDDAQRFAITPHVYDERMEELYREGDGFIFETMVFWATAQRQRWIEQAIDRMRRLAAERGVSPFELRVLVMGDKTGCDSLKLADEGFRVAYFDAPGTKTFAFAQQRFLERGLLGRDVRVVTDYNGLLSYKFDVVLSFEVLEHLPDPRAAIRDLARLVADRGIALVTESFGLVTAQFPTHLASNARYESLTPFLFLANGLVLTWYSVDPAFKPAEFQRVAQAKPEHWMTLMRNPTVVRSAVGSRLVHLRRSLIPRG